MADITVRPMWQIDHDVLGRLSKSWTGHKIRRDAVIRMATLVGLVGRVVHGASKEMILGFAAGTVSPSEVYLSWLAADPDNRLLVLKALLNSLRKEFPGVDIVVRIPNNEGKYEFLADLRDASGGTVQPDASRTAKVSDEQASYVYVRLGGVKDIDGGGGRDRQAALVRYAGNRP